MRVGTRASEGVKLLHVTERTCHVSVPKELAWVTADLDENDPLYVLHFVPEAVDALVVELQRVFPGHAAPHIFTTHPFTASSVQDSILHYLADITPAPAANHTQVHCGCMIGPNNGPEFTLVNNRHEAFQHALPVLLGLDVNNLQVPIARPYGIYEGRAGVLLRGVAVGSGAPGVFIG